MLSARITGALLMAQLCAIPLTLYCRSTFATIRATKPARNDTPIIAPTRGLTRPIQPVASNPPEPERWDTTMGAKPTPMTLPPKQAKIMHSHSANSPELDGESYSEETPLTILFGDGPKVRILAALLADPELDHNVTEIAEMAGVSRNTVYRHLDDLLDIGVVRKTRETGGSPRYKIDKENPAAKKLAELEWELVDFVFEK